MAGKVLASMREDYAGVSEGYWKRLLAGARPDVEKQIRGEMKRLPQDAGLAIIEAIFAYDPLPDLRAYRGAKLIVDTPHGEGPGALHAQAPEVPRQVMTGTSHWPHRDEPDEFNRILDGFLGSLR
jgi:pimeloyl-ACP methyl ester carboxylesterase